VRVVIGDDNLFVRDGLASLLQDTGIEVAARAAGPDELVSEVGIHQPDVAIVDIRMPPTHKDEGLRAALEIRARQPDVGIMILSEHVEVGVVTRMLAERPEGLGYMLKLRVTDLDDFVGSLRTVAAGGTALDPQVVTPLLAARRNSTLNSLTPREREVLQLVAEGRTNKAIGDQLDITSSGVRKHVTAIFAKLGLPAGDDAHRRILAVLAYLRPKPE
jgi:DNA-binding NarL/FixJ family response regulator